MSEFWTTVRKARLKRLWEVEKLSQKACAEAIGDDCTIGMVAGQIRGLGLSKERELVWHDARVAALKSLWAAGASCRLIAVDLKCSIGAVEQKVRELDLPKRKVGALHEEKELTAARAPSRVGTGVIAGPPVARGGMAGAPRVVLSRKDPVFAKSGPAKTKREMMEMLKAAVENTK